MRALFVESAGLIEKESTRDYQFFSVVQWEENLVFTAKRLIRAHQLKVLDAAQLASGLISRADTFITSDRRLYAAARKEIPAAKFI